MEVAYGNHHYGKLMRKRIFNTCWRVTRDWRVFVEGTITQSTNDDYQRERKIDWELRVPRVLWRPYCWARGHHEPYYNCCIFCEQRINAR